MIKLKFFSSILHKIQKNTLLFVFEVEQLVLVEDEPTLLELVGVKALLH